MSSRWQKARRLPQMSWDEVRARLGQEFNKRLDLALYRVGVNLGLQRAFSRVSKPGSFFFPRGDAPARAAMVREHLPEEAQRIVEGANQILDHRFTLLGYPPLDYGAEIDWHLDAVHGKRAPLKAWYKIPFLDFSQVGDHKVIWELNRHQHLVTLAKAWCLTRDERYRREAVSQWRSWQNANPYPLGINWASALEVAFRSMSWLWIRHLLWDADESALGPDLIPALGVHGRHIERYLSTYFSPNTHLIGEAVALFFIGALCPELPSAERWRNSAWKIVLNEARRQVRPDGVYFEQALYYHVYALDFFLHARLLAHRNGIQIPDEFDGTLLRMLAVLQALSQTGPPQNFGDDDGGRVFDPTRNRPEHMTDPLAIGAVAYGRETFASTSKLTEESVWLLGQEAVAMLSGPRRQLAPASLAFPDGGLYLMADSGHGGARMVIDAGPQGTARGGHGHADALAIQFNLGGRPWLVDPGTGSYASSNNERTLFRGTGAHNTVRVDGVDQAVPDGAFAWRSLPNVKTDRWIAGESFEYFAGRHDGFTRLPDPVLHKREVFHLQRHFWFIRDQLEGQNQHLIETFLHFAPDLEVTRRGDMLLAAPKGARDGKSADLQLGVFWSAGPNWDVEIGSAPFSPAYGISIPAPTVSIRKRLSLPAQFAFLLVPLAHKTGQGELSHIHEQSGDGVHAYRFDDRKSMHYLLSAGRSRSWTFGAWASDASFLYYGLRDGRLTHFVLLDGSFARWQNKPVATHRHSVERFEWTNAWCAPQRSCGEASLDFFGGSDLDCLDPVL